MMHAMRRVAEAGEGSVRRADMIVLCENFLPIVELKAVAGVGKFCSD